MNYLQLQRFQPAFYPLSLKYWEKLFFGRDQTVWDKTLNWGLVYDHNEIFYFGKNRIYNSDIEAEKIYERKRMIEEAMVQIEFNKSKVTKKYSENPFLK
ncbi:MAG: hypothetical protein ACXWW0_08485 [Bacteroidia bacterium]